MSQRVFLVEGARTPILKARGKPGPFAAADLASQLGRALLERSPIPTERIDEVILGCVMPSEREANIGRVATLRMGLSEHVPAWTVQRNCASGMQAMDCAINRVQLGESDVVLAGGVEAMSRAPVMFQKRYVDWLAGLMGARSLPARLKHLAAFRLSMLSPVFALERGLTDPVVSLNMGETAEKIAARFNVSREAMDTYAVQSHHRLARAQQEDIFSDEVIPLFDEQGNLYAADDGVRPDSSVDKLSTLKPVFEKPYGKVTAANSSQISDGAAWTLLVSERIVEEFQLDPIAELKQVCWAGLDPSEMGLGPVYAISKLLSATGLKMADIDFWEINEAFAAQVLACQSAFESEEYCQQYLGHAALGSIPEDRLNIHGSAIACGHPVGMSGARISLHIANILKSKNARRGIASLCIGGGQGGAILVERLSAGGES